MCSQKLPSCLGEILPPALLSPSTNLSSWKSSLYLQFWSAFCPLHLSQIHCMQCLFWAYGLCSPQHFRACAQVPQNTSSAKQCVRRVSPAIARTSEDKPLVHRNRGGSSVERVHRATYTNTQLLTKLPKTDSTGGTPPKHT